MNIALADEKGTPVWKAWGVVNKGSLLASIGRASNAVQMITSGIAALRSTGARFFDAAALIKFGQGLCGTRPIR